MVQKKGILQNLNAIGVLIEDTDARSMYFNMNVPDVLSGGKTAISIDPPPSLLKVSSHVKVELLDANGNPVYVEFPNDPYVPAYEYGYSEANSTARLIGITIYPDTPYGYGELVVVGEAIKILPSGISTPTDWKGVYNVRWRKRVLINPNLPNNSKVIFYKTPSVVVSEVQKPYFNQTYTAGKTVTITGSAVYQTAYGVATLTATDFAFTQDMVGGKVAIPSPNAPTSFLFNKGAYYGQYITYITSLVNNKQANVRDIYLATQAGSAAFQYYVSPTDKLKYLAVPYFDSSSVTMSYNAQPTYSLSPNLKSFVKFNILELDTFSGDLWRIKAFQSSDGTIGGFKVISEKNLEDTEILFNYNTTPDAQYMGVFAGIQTYNQYWATSSFDFKTNGESSVSASIGADSNTLMNGLVVSSSVVWNGTNNVIHFLFPTTQSYFKTGDQLELKFKLANLSGDGQFDVYASGSAFYQDIRKLDKSWDGGRGGTPLVASSVYDAGYSIQPAVNKFGRLLKSFSPSGVGQFKTAKKLYGTITAPLQADYSGSGSINIAIRGGQWVVSDISFVYKRETNFSPSAFTFAAPLEPEQEGDSLVFGLKYYNKLGEEVIIPKTPSPNSPPNMTLGQWDFAQNYGTFGEGVNYSKTVTGPNTYIDGTRNVMSGSLWIASNVGHYRYGEIVASGGMELSVDSAPGPGGTIGVGALYRSLGYQGWVSASKDAPIYRPGFMIWSGSILPGSGDNYSGVGIELWASGSAMRFRTDLNMLEITGAIVATSGLIGGWQILAKELRSYPSGNLSLSGSGAGYIVARDKGMIDRVFIGITPDSVTASDGFRDPTKNQGPELIYNQWFNIGAGHSDGWSSSAYVNFSAGDIPPSYPGYPAPAYPGAMRFSPSSSQYASGSQHIINYTPSTTDTLSAGLWAISIGYPYWAIYANWYQVSGIPTSSAYTLYQTDLINTHNLWEYKQVSFTPVTTCSVKFEISVGGLPFAGQYIFVDGVSIRAIEDFTDVSQRGVFIYDSPTRYIKLGAGTGETYLTSVTASYLYGRISASLPTTEITKLSIGSTYGLSGGVFAGVLSIVSGSWPANDFYIPLYINYTSSTDDRSGEPYTGWAGISASYSDFNYYTRIGGGGSTFKSRGWVFADSSGGGHTPFVHILGGNTPFLSGSAGAIIINGPLYSWNPGTPSKMLWLNVTGSQGYVATFSFQDGNQGAGKALYSDADGNAYWSASGAGGGGVTQIVAGTNITISPAGGTGIVTVNSSGGGGTGISWAYATASLTMSANYGYIVSGSGQVVLCLPTGSQTGSVFEVVGKTGSWMVTPNPTPASQSIFFGYMTASYSPNGYLSSSLTRDSIRLVCVSASYEFNVISSVGDIFIQ